MNTINRDLSSYKYTHYGYFVSFTVIISLFVTFADYLYILLSHAFEFFFNKNNIGVFLWIIVLYSVLSSFYGIRYDNCDITCRRKSKTSALEKSNLSLSSIFVLSAIILFVLIYLAKILHDVLTPLNNYLIPPSKNPLDVSSVVVNFGLTFCFIVVIISLLILFICLPIFLFSSDEDRVFRAGGLVKTTLGFFITGSSAIMATISFKGPLK